MLHSLKDLSGLPLSTFGSANLQHKPMDTQYISNHFESEVLADGDGVVRIGSASGGGGGGRRDPV